MRFPRMLVCATLSPPHPCPPRPNAPPPLLAEQHWRVTCHAFRGQPFPQRRLFGKCSPCDQPIPGLDIPSSPFLEKFPGPIPHALPAPHLGRCFPPPLGAGRVGGASSFDLGLE